MTDKNAPVASLPFPQEIVLKDMVLTLVPDQVYLEFTDTLSTEEIKAFNEQYRLQPVERASTLIRQRDVAELPGRVGRFQWSTGEDTARFIADISASDSIRNASPVYHRADLLPADTTTSFADKVLVHFGPDASEKEIGALIASFDTEIVATEAFVRDGTLYQLRLRFPKRQDIFALVNDFAQSSLVRYAGPDWIQLQSPSCSITPLDPLFKKQWNLQHIAAPEGWDFTQGNESVIIAIIDSGCMLNHPDLAGKYVPKADHFDVLGNENLNLPGDPPFFHGTLCAGVAAAMTNNNVGIAGVAPGCSIMPIRLYYGETLAIRSQLDIVVTVNWARKHGAAVINMSWAYANTHTLADIAIEDAYESNVVMVASSGNCYLYDNCTTPAYIYYPATHPRVIAVGSTNKNDLRIKQDNASLTADAAYDSRYGSQLSVMAPGVDCWTTSIDKHNNGTIYDTFYGTSAAAPHVAGLAALLISLLQHPINIPPSLQMNDLVRSIIEGTAAKVGNLSYATDVAHPNGTWNAEMGYGLIDVYSALRFAHDHFTRFQLERINSDYVRSVLILFGLTPGGPGVVFSSGKPRGPIDPGWLHLSPEQRDVVLGLAITELAKGLNDPRARQMLGQAGWAAIEQTAKRMGKDS